MAHAGTCGVTGLPHAGTSGTELPHAQFIILKTATFFLLEAISYIRIQILYIQFFSQTNHKLHNIFNFYLFERRIVYTIFVF